MRPAAFTDAPARRAIRRAIIVEEIRSWGLPALQSPPLVEVQLTAQVQAFGDRPCWLVEDEGAPVALVIVEADHIVDLAVHPDAQGKGIGTRIIIELQRRHDTLTLEVRRDRARLVSWYRRLGFEEIEDAGAIHLRMRWARPAEEARNGR